MSKYHKLKSCTIRMEPDAWEEVLRIAKAVDGDENAKSAARLVRRCVEHCFRQGIVTKLANMKEK
jgi:hypothetical protein